MRPLFLKLDDSLERQGVLGAMAEPIGARAIEAGDFGPRLRLWGPVSELLALEQRLRVRPPQGPELVFAGSGDFHHITQVLLRRAIKAAAYPETTVVDLGGQPNRDWPGPQFHCRAWAAEARRQPQVKELMAATGTMNAEAVIARIRTPAVYLTIDKRGLDLQHIERLVGRIVRARRVIGVEVFGDWSKPVFAGGRLEVLSKRLRALSREPLRLRDERTRRAADQHANLRLLALFAERAATRPSALAH